MIITAKNSSGGVQKLNLSFDIYGNMYFDKVVNGKLIKSYQVNIDGRNNPYADPGDYKIYNAVNKKHTIFQIINENGMLKKKVHNELEKYDIFDQAEEFEDNWEDNFYQNFPERKEFIDTNIVDSEGYIDEDLVNKYGQHNEKFNFSHLSGVDSMPIFEREYGDVSALYDTYVYEEGILRFRSSSKSEESIYTIKVHNNGYIDFRPDGQKEISFDILFVNDDKLLFVRHEEAIFDPKVNLEGY